MLRISKDGSRVSVGVCTRAPRRLAGTRILLAWVFVAGLSSALFGEPLQNPSAVEFVPSIHHNTLLPNGAAVVTNYVVGVYMEGAAEPFHTIDIGKPNPEPNGIIHYDFSNALASWPLPGGTYEIRVDAVGPRGSSLSSPSNQFVLTPPPCEYSAAPAQLSISSGSEAPSLTLNATPGCAWTAVSDVSWVVVSPQEGSGSASVVLSVQANPTTSSRTGTVVVAGQTVSVMQAARSPITDTRPNVTNASREGSLIIWPDIRVDNHWNTIVRIQNNGNLDVTVLCSWIDGNQNKVYFAVTMTRDQPVWFEAKGGSGSTAVSHFPATGLSGYDNPDLITPGFVAETTLSPLQPGDSAGPYSRGLLACWAVDAGAEQQVKWNHLSGTATVFNSQSANVLEYPGAYQYTAHAFWAPTGLDLEPVGIAGILNLNGIEFDSCPQYLIGQFTAVDRRDGPNASPDLFSTTIDGFYHAADRLMVAGCNLNLNQDWFPVRTALKFDVWNAEGMKFTGALECAGSWHETVFAGPESFAPSLQNVETPLLADLTLAQAGGSIDEAAANFSPTTLGTRTGRYRLQGVKSTSCAGSVAVGLVGVQSTQGVFSPTASFVFGTALPGTGKVSGRLTWDPGGVPEGTVR